MPHLFIRVCKLIIRLQTPKNRVPYNNQGYRCQSVSVGVCQAGTGFSILSLWKGVICVILRFVSVNKIKVLILLLITAFLEY